MAGMLVAVWFFVFGTMIKSVYLHQLLWPEDGDRDDRKSDKDSQGRRETD
jgi:hypothetical protein